MIPKQYQRHCSFLEPLHVMERNKQKIHSGTFSPETIATTSSGYSTGDSSILTKTSSHQHKIKTKGFTNLIKKVKNLFLTSSSKKSKEMPLITIQTQGSIIPTSNTISLPFTYYQHNFPMEKSQLKHTNFDQISAWLDHTGQEQSHDEIFFIDEHPSTSTNELNQQYLIMKKTPTNNVRIPKRSTSLVSTLSRPFIEKRSTSPTPSFSSSILIRGMSESLTPQKISHLSRSNLQLADEQIKINRRRVIDFSRRRTITGLNESLNNKENQRIYPFSSSISNNPISKKYYFRRNSEEKTDDILMNSYGLKILQQDKPKTYSSSIENFHPKYSLKKQSISHRFIHPQCSSDSLEDLLCDREVESYFYPPSSSSSQHIYVNFQTPIHGTLC